MAADEAAAVETLVILHDFLIQHQDGHEAPEDSEMVHDMPYSQAGAYHGQHVPLHGMQSQASSLHQGMQASPWAWQQQHQFPTWSAWPLYSSNEPGPGHQYQSYPYDQSWGFQEDCSVGPSLEYDKQPRPTTWQPDTDTDQGSAASRKYWKLGKLGRGPETEAEKVQMLWWLLPSPWLSLPLHTIRLGPCRLYCTIAPQLMMLDHIHNIYVPMQEKRMRVIQAKQFSEAIRQYNMYQVRLQWQAKVTLAGN